MPLIIAALVFAAITYVFYMTVLHPLARYPGPFLAKLTNIYPLYHAIRGTTSDRQFELHEKHGDFVRWAPNFVSINNAAALQPIYGTKANVQKSQFYRAFFGVSIFNVIDKQVHARKRRVMNQAFSETAIRELQPYMIGSIKQWCAALGDRLTPEKSPEKALASSDCDRWSSPKDMTTWGGYGIFDSFGELLFGQSFDTTSSSQNRVFFDLMPSRVRFSNTIAQIPSLYKLGIDKLFVRSRRIQMAFVAVSVRALKKRLALGSNDIGRKDIIHHLQSARDSETGQGYTETELISETVLLMGAGLDTTHTAMVATLYFLVHNPAILKRLTESIRRDFASVDDIQSGPTLAANLYLRACIDEAMRLCPSGATGPPREVCPGGLEVLGHKFAPGTELSVPTYVLHHSAANFDRPFEYDPSRWLVKGEGADPDEGNEPEIVKRQRHAFVPFSLGPRMCIAKKFAKLNMQLSIARLLYTYDMRIAPGKEHVNVGPHGEYKVRNFLVVEKNGPVLQFRAAKADVA